MTFKLRHCIMTFKLRHSTSNVPETSRPFSGYGYGIRFGLRFRNFGPGVCLRVLVVVWVNLVVVSMAVVVASHYWNP